jgi:hypothetical protein
MTKQTTTVVAKMIFKIALLHATLPELILLGFRSRRAAANSLSASRAFTNASSTDSAWVHIPGSSGDDTTKPPSGAASMVSTSFPSLIVYFLAMADVSKVGLNNTRPD